MNKALIGMAVACIFVIPLAMATNVTYPIGGQIDGGRGTGSWRCSGVFCDEDKTQNWYGLVASDNIYSVAKVGVAGDLVQDAKIQLFYVPRCESEGCNIIYGEDKAQTSVNWPKKDAVATYGGAADEWGMALNGGDLSSCENFGVIIRAKSGMSSTKDLYVTFPVNSLPADADINGYSVSIERSRPVSNANARIDQVALTIDYT